MQREKEIIKTILWQFWLAVMLTLMIHTDFCIIDNTLRIKPGREFIVGGTIFIFLLASVRDKLR